MFSLCVVVVAGHQQGNLAGQGSAFFEGSRPKGKEGADIAASFPSSGLGFRAVCCGQEGFLRPVLAAGFSPEFFFRRLDRGIGPADHCSKAKYAAPLPANAGARNVLLAGL